MGHSGNSFEGRGNGKEKEIGVILVLLSALRKKLKITEEKMSYKVYHPLQDKDGKTPLHHAVYSRQYKKVCKILIEQRNNTTDFINQTTNDGNTALNYMFLSNEIHLTEEIMLILLFNGAKVGIRNNKNKSSIEYAKNFHDRILRRTISFSHPKANERANIIKEILQLKLLYEKEEEKALEGLLKEGVKNEKNFYSQLEKRK